MIDSEGELVLECHFDDIGELAAGLAFAKVNGKAGFISADGSWAIQPIFERCYPFFGVLAIARRTEGGFSYIRRNGNIVWTSDVDAQPKLPYGLRSA